MCLFLQSAFWVIVLLYKMLIKFGLHVCMTLLLLMYHWKNCMSSVFFLLQLFKQVSAHHYCSHYSCWIVNHCFTFTSCLKTFVKNHRLPSWIAGLFLRVLVCSSRFSFKSFLFNGKLGRQSVKLNILISYCICPILEHCDVLDWFDQLGEDEWSTMQWKS